MRIALPGTTPRRLALAACLALAAACTPENSPLMRPGEDCMQCHGGRGGEEEGPRWTIAGTVYGSAAAPAQAGVQDAQVQVTDAAGRTFTLRSNGAGNFYSAEDVALPLNLVCVVRGASRACMSAAPGDCNRCHVTSGEAGTRVFVP